ncbi:MAG: hypothetical protein ACJ796_01960 [Gemmatimonadaceae bacterium]
MSLLRRIYLDEAGVTFSHGRPRRGFGALGGLDSGLPAVEPVEYPLLDAGPVISVVVREERQPSARHENVPISGGLRRAEGGA